MSAPLQLVSGVQPAGPTVSVTQLVAREKKRAVKRRVIGLTAVALVVVCVGLLAYFLRPRPTPLALRFRTQAVTVGPVVHEVTATGHLEAESAVSIGAEVSGRIATVEVDYNSRVKAGQVLARFDKSVLEAQVSQTRALLAAAKAQVAQARFDNEHAQRSLARSTLLYSQKSQSEQEHEAVVTTSQLARVRVEAMQAQVAAQEAALAVALGNLSHAEVRAPNDGIVITRNVEPGQTVASMLQSPVLFTVAANLERMRVVALVDEADIGDVVVGQHASFTVTAWPERTFSGEVIEVRNSPVIAQDVVSYGVVVAVDNKDLSLKPGMTASVRVRTAEVDSVTRVPSASLHFTPPGEQRQRAEGAVWILDAETVRKVPVTPGVTDGELTAVSTQSLPPGTRVLVDLTAEGRRFYGLEPKR